MPKISSIHLAVLVEHRLVTDTHTYTCTDKHTVTQADTDTQSHDHTALA